MQKLRRWIPAAFCLGGFACADIPTDSLHPKAIARAYQQTATVDGQEYMVFESEEEARANLGWARIIETKATTYWEGNTAVGSGTMYYYGNRGEQSYLLQVRNHKTSASGSSGPVTDSHVFADSYSFQAGGFRVSLPGSTGCGGVADLGGTYTAKIVFLIQNKYLPTELSSAGDYDSDTKRQPDCPPEPCPDKVTAGSGGDAPDCYVEKDEPSPGGGDCPECVEQPAATYCRVQYWYWKDTGEIFKWDVLWCA